MQGMLGPTMNLAVLLAAILILITIPAVSGYSRKTRERRYWIIAAVEVIVFFILWQLLTVIPWLLFTVHVPGPEESKLLLVNIANFVIYLGVCLSFVLVETHRRIQ